MDIQVTGKERWAEVSTNCGTEFVAIEELGIALPDNLDIESLASARELLAEYVEGKQIYDYQIIEGYGARLSMPGYLDCTPWTVHDTEEEAEAYIEELYDDDSCE